MYDVKPDKSKAKPKDAGPALGFVPRSAQQAQALNQAPDSIPAMVKPGEFVLPPDTVHAMGGPEQLHGIVAATHTPAPNTAVVPKGFKPEVFFADGEFGKDERNRPNFFPGNSPDAGANIYAGFGPSKAPAAAAKPTQVPATQVEGWRTKAVMDGAAEDAQALWERGNIAGTAGALTRGAITAIPTAIGEVAYNTVAPIARGIGGFYEGLTGGTPDAPSTSNAGMPAPTTAAKPVAPAAGTGVSVRPEDSPAITDARSATTVATAPAAQAAQPANQPRQVADGVYAYGRGQYGDNPSGMGFPAGFTGRPNAQNNAAAENLAINNQVPAVSAAQGAPAVITSPTVRYSGNDWQARNDLRNLEVSASSITNRPGYGAAGRGQQAPAVEAYQAALNADLAARNAQPGFDMAAARENAALQREGMQQAGATTRAGIQEQGANRRDGNRTALAAQELDMKREAQGFQTRAAQQLETLRNIVLDPKATPEQRKQAQDAILVLSGKADESPYEFKVSPTIRNADGSTTEGSAWRFNRATGQAERVDGGQRAIPPLKENPAAMAIVNNDSLSLEQRREALKKLGYQ
jgi:hypothetical protein